MILPQQAVKTKVPLDQPRLYAERSFTGYGQERGGVRTILRNPSVHEAVEFVYLESLPWFMRTFLHTLSAKRVPSSSSNNNHDDQHIISSSASSDAEEIIHNLYYRPALDRHRPTHLEMRMSVPANSTVMLSYAFEKAILRYTEYPPDANRGFDIPPAIIRLSSPASPSSPSYIRTTTLLLSLPTPDFSMPYNVIILTSTVMALAFGHLFNLLVRRFVAADEVEPAAAATRLKALLRRLRLNLRRAGGDAGGEEDEHGHGHGDSGLRPRWWSLSSWWARRKKEREKKMD